MGDDAAKPVGRSKVDRVVIIIAVGHVGFRVVDNGGEGEEAAPLVHVHGAGDGGVEVGDGPGIE